MPCSSCGRENRSDSRFCDECGANLAAAVADAPSVLAQSATSTDFVGRRQEMGSLRAVLEDAIAGQGHLVMLVGEPGIGKTRTAEELVAYAETLGAQVLWGRCYEEEGAPPYWPWLQATRSYIQQQTPEQLQAKMGSGAADIAEILPEVREKLPNLEPPSSLEPEQARFRLFSSFTTFLKNAAQSQPMVLVLDDLHWADKPSLLLLQFLARELDATESGRILVVGTYRDMELSRQHPLSETLAQLSRSARGGFQRVLLRGLDQQDTAQFIEASAGIEPTTRLVEALYSRTEGNPFFMTEVIRLLSESGELTADHVSTPEGLRIPEGVREVIGQRLNRLSEPCNEVLTTASIIGREFDFRLLNMLSGSISEDQLLQAVEQAVSAHLIEDLPAQMDHYQFSHALIQQTLAEEVTTSRRVRLHARIGEALEDLYGAGVEDHASELAHHFAQAEPVLGVNKLAHYSKLAGEQALAAFGWEEAEFHFRRALEAKRISLDSTEPADDAETAELLFGLGRAQVGVFPLYRVREAVATLNRAFTYYADVLDADRALSVVQYPIYGIGVGRSSGRAEMLERALQLIPPDSHLEGHLLTDYGLALGLHEGDYHRAQASFDRALVIARRDGNTSLEMRSLCFAARVDRLEDQPQESLEKSLRAIKLAPLANDLASLCDAHQMAGHNLATLGDPEAARYHAVASLAPAEQIGDRFTVLNVLRLDQRLAMLVGDWDMARHVSDRGLAMAPLDSQLLLSRILLEYQEGDFGQGAWYVERLIEGMRMATPGPNFDTAFLAMAISMAARITGMPERLEIAETAAEAALSSSNAIHSVILPARMARAILSIFKNDVVGVTQHYAVLKSEAGGMLQSSVITVDRVLGLLAHSMGDLGQSVDHFENSLGYYRQAGYGPELAWTCCDYADTLLERNEGVDRERSITLLNESMGIAANVGILPLKERVTERLDWVQAQPSPGTTYPDGLSQREMEVLRLVSQGKSNSAIAEELFISPNTVAHHVTNILNKTNSSNRTEAATYAARHGLT